MEVGKLLELPGKVTLLKSPLIPSVQIPSES